MSDASATLSAAGRIALRKAITNSDGWNSAFRNKHGLNLATMARADYFRAARLLDIDVDAILRDAVSERAAAAADAFTDAAPVVKSGVVEHSRPDTRTEAQRARDDADEDMKTAARATLETPKDDAPVSDDRISRLATMLADMMTTTVDETQVRRIVDAEITRALAEHGGPVVRIEITESGLPVGKVDGFQHPEFAKLLRSATARDAAGYSPNVWIAGPAGSGKTYAVGQVARALDLPFHYNGAIGMAHELLGFIDAGGTYHRTAFREAYEHGGCYLFDEVDGSDNAALLALNAALANGSATFPDGVVKRHKDCRIFAAANTWGFGATAEYVGRSKLDAAFLSRFPVRIMWSYDDALEQNICGNPEFARMVQRARKAAATLGLKVLITPRDSMAGAALVAAGFGLVEAAEMTYLASLTDAQRNAMQNQLRSGL